MVSCISGGSIRLASTRFDSVRTRPGSPLSPTWLLARVVLRVSKIQRLIAVNSTNRGAQWRDARIGQRYFDSNSSPRPRPLPGGYERAGDYGNFDESRGSSEQLT